MTEANIGRLLAACLHQAIEDVLPMRLEFYEEWLRSENMRAGSIGAAPMSAVLGFLRIEPAYEAVVTRAGQLAAQWTVESMRPVTRRAIRALPRYVRARAVMRVVTGIARETSSATETSMRFKRSRGRLEVSNSLFCTVRAPQNAAMCGFFSGVTVVALRMFDLPAQSEIERCLAVAGSSCVLNVDLL